MSSITKCRTILTICHLALPLLLYIDVVQSAQLYSHQRSLREANVSRSDISIGAVTEEANVASQKVIPESKLLAHTPEETIRVNSSLKHGELMDTANNSVTESELIGNDEDTEENITLVPDFSHLVPAAPTTGMRDNSRRDILNNDKSSRPQTPRIEERSSEENNFEIKSKSQNRQVKLNSESNRETESLRVNVGGSRGVRDARIGDKMKLNMSQITESLLRKTPYSEHWSAEEKWDHIYKKFLAIQDRMKDLIMKNLLKDAEYYADIAISPKCSEDLKFIQEYQKKSTNYRWLVHMVDSLGKAESGMLAGNLADLGHVIQCIKVRAPLVPSNETFQERYFEAQTKKLGERFRGKYCLASLRPVLPEKPYLVSRFSEILDTSILSNISYMGEEIETLKQLATQTKVPDSVYDLIDKEHNRLDQIPFESELFQFLIFQRNFMYTLPKFIGVCFPSSCTKDDIRYSLQKSFDYQHQVVDLEFECEVEEDNSLSWLNTPRLIAFVLFSLVVFISFSSSVARYILVDKLQVKRNLKEGSNMANIVQILDFLSMDKCAGILFIKTKQASPLIDETKIENSRSTSIDALKGFLILLLVYSQLTQLGCLPVPFMWSKWADSMFPFYRSFSTQIFINTSIWAEAFYVISSYLITAKILENYRPNILQPKRKNSIRFPNFSSYVLNRYVRLVLPTVGFILMNYVWPRFSNGFVMQDQSKKILEPCDKYAWTNVLLFHNHYGTNETCLWPTFISASFFQLHLISFPIILILIASLRAKFDPANKRQIMHKVLKYCALGIMALLAILGLVYPALVAMNQNIIVPFLIDYIDYDNYRRVIEWTVMPTYNHVTSYMFGIWLAFMVVLERAEAEVKVLSLFMSSESTGTFIPREGSFDSMLSSTTQELNCRPLFKEAIIDNQSQQQHQTGMELTSNHQQQNRHLPDLKSNQPIIKQVDPFLYRGIGEVFLNVLLDFLFALGILISLTASWYWNGAGQPMSSAETFWFMVGTKLLFNITFCYLFYKYIATRHNSEDPWMITRFLVPIGRMSLTAFYVSWLVIWFDLLTSLYQWHPSHYFVFEKFNEIIFMTLILAMFAYGAFEGSFKSIQYARRSDKLKRQRQQSGPAIVLQTSILRSSTSTLRDIVPTQGFHNMFEPICNDIDEEDELGSESPQKAGEASGGNFERGGLSGRKESDKGFGTTATTTAYLSHDQARHRGVGDSSDGTDMQTGIGTGEQRAAGKHLSIVDQYKLNAELRANYSFASIRLYESAGATDDLPQHTSNDPQVSLKPTSDNGKRQQEL